MVVLRTVPLGDTEQASSLRQLLRIWVLTPMTDAESLGGSTPAPDDSGDKWHPQKWL